MEQRLIDANVLKNTITKHSYIVRDRINSTGEGMFTVGIMQAIDEQPTIDAVPTEFVMENFNLEFVCDELTDCGEECSERCQYSEPQQECIHRYIDTIWRKEHDKID